jgi:hypothetical protein
MTRAAAKKVTKVSVSLASDDEAWIREVAERERRPFSLVLGDVVRQARRDQAWRAVRDDLLAGVALTDAELASADREIRRARARRR